MQFKDNMNAKCFCGHSMAQHKAGGGPCGPCNCTYFTEKVEQVCRYCGELVPIRTAPDDKVTRVSYNDPSGKNYAHTECYKKAGTQRKSGPIFSRVHPKQAQTFQKVGVLFGDPELKALSSILFKLGAFEMDGSIAEGDWTDDELTLLAQLSATT